MHDALLNAVTAHLRHQFIGSCTLKIPKHLKKVPKNPQKVRMIYSRSYLKKRSLAQYCAMALGCGPKRDDTFLRAASTTARMGTGGVLIGLLDDIILDEIPGSVEGQKAVVEDGIVK